MRLNFRVAAALSAGVAISQISGLAFGANVTAQPYVPIPQKVNLVFNRSASVDTSAPNFSGWFNDVDVVLRPSAAKYAQVNIGAGGSITGQKYTVAIGNAYNTSALEFIFARYNSAYIPGTFTIYAAPINEANLYQPAYAVANQSTPGLINSDRIVGEEGVGFTYQQIRLNLAAPQTVYKFGIQVNSWAPITSGSSSDANPANDGTDQRAFLLAGSANPTSDARYFDGEIGLLNNTWNPGAVLTANHTVSGPINNTQYYDTDDWSDPRWYGDLSDAGGTLSVTQHLADTYKLDAIRWAAGQQYAPTQYQIFAANSAGTPLAGDWVAVTGVISGTNYGTTINFTTPFNGNWIRIDATAVTNGPGQDLWVNTKWQVYGTVIPEPGTLSLLGLATLGILGRRRSRIG